MTLLKALLFGQTTAWPNKKIMPKNQNTKSV